MDATGAQQVEHIVDAGCRTGLDSFGLVGNIGMLHVIQQRLWHVLRREYIIDEIGGYGMARHAVEFGGFGILRDAQPTRLLDIE